MSEVGCARLSVTHLPGRERKWEQPSTIHSNITRDFSKLIGFLPERLFFVQAFATYTLFHMLINWINIESGFIVSLPRRGDEARRASPP